MWFFMFKQWWVQRKYFLVSPVRRLKKFPATIKKYFCFKTINC